MEVFKKPCKNCLLSKDAIVSPERVQDLLSSCVKEQTHFVCHKSSMDGGQVCCNLFYKKLGNSIGKIIIAKELNIVRFVEQKESEKLIPYRNYRP